MSHSVCVHTGFVSSLALLACFLYLHDMPHLAFIDIAMLARESQQPALAAASQQAGLRADVQPQAPVCDVAELQKCLKDNDGDASKVGRLTGT